MHPKLLLERRPLGQSGLCASEIGLGTMGLGGLYGATTEPESISAIHRALDVGMTLINTADFYGLGEVERVIGRALATRRAQAMISTKIGMRLDENQRPTRMDGRPEYLQEACEASLRRLGVEVIDVLILCRLDPAVPVEESVGALADLVTRGKARSIGLSEVSSRTIRRAHAAHPIAAVEAEFSLWERHVEEAILPATRELGIALLAHTPLGRGFLTASYASQSDLPANDSRRHHPRFQGDNFSRNRSLVEGVTALARRNHATSAQVALAWLLRKAPSVIPIPGTRRVDRIEENAGAADIQLDDADMRELDALFVQGSVAGERQASFYMAGVDQD